MADTEQLDLQTLTAEIVAAYVSNNQVSSEEIAGLISSTYQALHTAASPIEAAEPDAPKPDKAAVKKSITPDHLVSFVDGRKYKSLKRHLTTQGMTPVDYRQRYGLPADYPMVAPNYSAQRSALAKTLGLGRKAAAASSEAPAAAAAPTKAPRRARAKAAS